MNSTYMNEYATYEITIRRRKKRSVYDWAAPVFKNILQYVPKVEVKTAERDTGILMPAQPI